MSRSPRRASPSARASVFFDPWLSTECKEVEALADKLALDFENSTLDRGAGTRRRKRRAQDRENLKEIIRAVLANLARSVASGSGPILTPLRKAQGSRKAYARPGFRQLPNVLKILARERVIKLKRSRTRGVASTIEPGALTAKALRKLERSGLKFDCADADKATVLISKSRILYERGGRRESRFYDAPDTPEVGRIHAEMQRINAAIAEADLIPQNLPRRLTRYFGDRELTCGGRLFGGFWQTLPKTERHAIRLEGETVAVVDFESLFPRLAYMAAGKPPPDGDLYADVPGEREGVKKVFNAMLFRLGRLTKFPKGSRKHFSKDTSASSVRAAIIARHPDLAPIFETGAGNRLMRTESDILVAVLLRLMDQGIPALPIHDAVLVRESAARRAARTMGDVAKRLTGYRLPVSVSLCAP